MMHCQNHQINLLIKSCGGIRDFRDIILLENCKIHEEGIIRFNMARRHFERKKHGYKRIK